MVNIVKRFVVLAAVLMVVAVPSAASADGEVAIDDPNDDYVYTGDRPGVYDNVSVEWGVGTLGVTTGYWFHPQDGTTVSGGCEPATFTSGRVCFPGAGDRFVVNLLSGNDVVTLRSSADMGLTPLPALVNGGTGNDDITGGPLADTLNGEAGNDTFRVVTGADLISGGAGIDVAVLETGPAAVILDGTPNEGAGAPNILADVENVIGSPQSDSLTGSAAANWLRGLGGPDSLNGLSGADVLDGGADDDVIFARDGAVDSVICGGGSDTANVDGYDAVSADCETVNRSFIDADRDGSPRGIDCVEGNAERHPRAHDKPHNGVDENCDGEDAAYLRPQGTIDTNWASFTTHTVVVWLKFSGIPRGGKVVVRCLGKGKGCPFAKRTLKVKKRRASATKLFKGAELRPGAVVEVRITDKDRIGSVVRYTIRSHALPNRRILCLPPGQRKPGKCR